MSSVNPFKNIPNPNEESVTNAIKQLSTMNQRKYRFKIHVREGKPGFADYDCYVSREYSAFEDAYRELVNFNVNGFWPYLRMLQRITIQKDSGVEEEVRQSNYGIMVDELVFLGVTEKEFDEIIERI